MVNETTVLITGNTYPVKDALRALGGRWDAARKGWRVPAAKAAEAQQLVSSATKPAPRAGRAGFNRGPRRPWSPCGYPGCNPTYCDECDGEGYRGGR